MAVNAILSLRQLGTPDLNQQPLCITFPTLEANAIFELKSKLIHLLPSFHGLAGENPHKHLMEFHVVCTSIKPHGVTKEQIQLRAFPFSLKSAAKIMVDAASGGVFVDKTPREARNLIENMAANSQQFGTNRSDPAPKKNNETAKACGICAAMGHATDMCPTLQEESVEQVNATDGFPGPPQRKYDPYSNTYNPGSKDHPNLSYENPPTNQPDLRHNRIIKPTCHRILHNSSALKFQRQLEQLATTINKLEAQHSNALPSQIVPNPRENASAIILRNGMEFKVKEKVIDVSSKKKQSEELKMDDKEATQGEAQKDFIKQVPRYAKFLKKLCTAKRKQTLKGCQKIELGENVSAVIQRKLPAKFKDPVEEIVTILNRAPELPQSDNLSYISLPIPNTRRLLSVLQAPIIELKTLPKHLKHVFLREGEILSVIISRSLEVEQEEQLVKVLKEHKTAI
ncbi:uncharacterized protein [Henckelia pumila]|uniref:uncharacterized protein n=1 Tax=Henckelia pumila TaxID=405737 RepID=UPI003C6E537A